MCPRCPLTLVQPPSGTQCSAAWSEVSFYLHRFLSASYFRYRKKNQQTSLSSSCRPSTSHPLLSLPLPFIFLERRQSTQPPLENAFLCTLSSTAVSTNEADKTLCAADHRSRFMSMRRIFPHEISTCPFKSPPLCNSAGLRHVFSPAPGSSQRHVEQHQQEEDGGRGERNIHINTSNMTDSVESALDCLLVCCV